MSPHVSVDRPQYRPPRLHGPQGANRRSQNVQVRARIAGFTPSLSRPTPDRHAFDTERTPNGSFVPHQYAFENGFHAHRQDHTGAQGWYVPPISRGRPLRQLLKPLLCTFAPDLRKAIGFSKEPVQVDRLDPAAEFVLGIPCWDKVPGHYGDIERLPPERSFQELIQPLSRTAHLWIARIHGHQVSLGDRNHEVKAPEIERPPQVIVPQGFQNLPAPLRGRRFAAFGE